MSLSVPSDLSDWFTIQFIIFFLVSFFIFSTNNGYSTLGFLDDNYDYDVSINSSVDDFGFVDYDPYLEYYEDLKFKVLPRQRFMAYILYFIVSPLVNYIFFFLWVYRIYR